MKRLSNRAIEIINELHTERLDYTSEYIPLIDAANRLAFYEDSGLEPEEIKFAIYAFAGKEIAKIEAFNGISIQRLKELAQAEKDGRLVVLYE